MNKSDLIEIINYELAKAASAGVKPKASDIFDALIRGAKESLRRDGTLGIQGFGSFKVVTRRGRTARNPQTGEPLVTQDHLAVKFRPGCGLKGPLE